jgi:hypothetical protein
MQIKIHNLSKVKESEKKRISQSLVWQVYTQIKFELNFTFWNSATSRRTSLGLGSQNGFYTDQQTAPPKVFI